MILNKDILDFCNTWAKEKYSIVDCKISGYDLYELYNNCVDISVSYKIFRQNASQVLRSRFKSEWFFWPVDKNTNISRWITYKESAEKRKLIFNLNIEQFYSILKNTCTYCGAKEKIGIDRVNNKIGYIIENCAPCCGTCNFIKKCMTIEQLKEHITKMYNHLNRPNEQSQGILVVNILNYYSL